MFDAPGAEPALAPAQSGQPPTGVVNPRRRDADLASVADHWTLLGADPPADGVDVLAQTPGGLAGCQASFAGGLGSGHSYQRTDLPPHFPHILGLAASIWGYLDTP
ncbi:hypothetical protein MALGJ_10110 [Mycolicibacter algericus]|uniref:Uncharacterized protein n=1 Tax=Mycolicibacter algericus TaxID=1288388 RepID=A0A7I9Y6N1_MYCAL|nr:hypothetical protein MALGJ_10110 [Mycolicibacter algericus]